MLNAMSPAGNEMRSPTKMSQNRVVTLLVWAAALLTHGLIGGPAEAQVVVTDFSDWSESGNLLAGTANDLEQDFTTSGQDITAAYQSHTINPTGQETFLTDEFAPLTTGDRISVELAAFGPGVTHTLGLAVASTETPGARENLFAWLFKSIGTAQLFTFDGAAAYGTINDVVIAPDTDTLFVEKSAIGWSFGGISTGGVETYYFTNVTSAGGVDLTADGSAFGVWSDLRTVNGSSMLTNFTVQENDVEVIYAEDFSGEAAVDLDGTTPDTTTGGAVWTAAPLFDANGEVNFTDAGRGSATLPFMPIDGVVYTLDVSLGDVTTAPDPGSSNDESWIGLGFARGQSSGTGDDFRFINESTVGDGVIGRAWTFNRGSGASGAFGNTAFLGNGGGAGPPNPGLASGAAWTTDAVTFGGNMTLRIVLDTTAGAGNWTATWYADTGAGLKVIRATTAVLDESINSVGLAVSSSFAFGSIESFSLTSVSGGVPNIIDIALDIEGNVVLTLDGPADGLVAQRSDDLPGFADVDSTAAGTSLTIDAANVDQNDDGSDFFRVRK